MKSFIHSSLVVVLAVQLTACAPDQKVAEVINGLVVAKSLERMDDERADTDLTSVSCSGRKHTLYGGSLTTKACTSPTEKDGKFYCPISVETDVVFQKAHDGIEEQKLSCILTATWEVDATSRRFIGGGAIQDCEVLNYRCTLGKVRLRCQDLQASLKRYTCN